MAALIGSGVVTVISWFSSGCDGASFIAGLLFRKMYSPFATLTRMVLSASRVIVCSLVLLSDRKFHLSLVVDFATIVFLSHVSAPI